MDKVRFEITSPCDLDNIFYGLANKYKGKTLSIFNIGVSVLPHANDHCALYNYEIKDAMNTTAIDHDLMRIKSSLPIIVIAPYSEYGWLKDKLSIGNHHWQLFLVNDKPISMPFVSTIVDNKNESAIYFDYSLVDILDRNKYPILTDYKHYDLVTPYAKRLIELESELRKMIHPDGKSAVRSAMEDCRIFIENNLYV